MCLLRTSRNWGLGTPPSPPLRGKPCEPPCGMKPINLSFSACGFLAIYHLGAASALCRHGRKLLKDVKAFAGASAGSLVASVLLTAPEKIEVFKGFVYAFAEETRGQVLGGATPGYDVMARLRSGMESVLPPDAHELAHSRLHVSISDIKTRENALVSSFPSREDLIQRWVDGGLTNSLPILPVGRTVTISPFSGRSDISPRDKGQLNLHLTVANQDVTLSVANLARLRQVLFPPRRTGLESLHQRGFDDAVRFLLEEDRFEQDA
ncbi:patatin-like phospholipase domain-containing protein 4 isoform X2 [Pteropus vampyrus]|uniref:Patatin-like phospholipase domain-containing protein 4 isoform X2 n=1 Tax=Pteropus vampyrus TaxID=132908 RepID=A0A6P6C007_PTEVA|nr:patatin-like phospholipase domain-containing protein 4 isoform X2 [Pteropus vampyrus]